MVSVSLAANTASYSLDAKAAGNALYPDPSGVVLAFPDIGMGRNYTAELGVASSIRLPRLEATTSYFGPDGRPTFQMMRFWQKFAEAIEQSYGGLAEAVNAIQVAYDAAAQATTAATEAASAVTEVRQEVATVTTTVEGIQTGEVPIEPNIGGQIFRNNGGTLEPEL